MLTMLLSAAFAADLTVTIRPINQPPLSCTAPDVRRGTLLSGPTLQMGEATVTPLIEVDGSFQDLNVFWRTALKVTQPGLISIARTDDRRDPQPCPMKQACEVVFHRDEQTVGLTVTFSGGAPLPAPPERPTWSVTSWYRDARQLSCEPLTQP